MGKVTYFISPAKGDSLIGIKNNLVLFMDHSTIDLKTGLRKGVMAMRAQITPPPGSNMVDRKRKQISGVIGYTVDHLFLENLDSANIMILPTNDLAIHFKMDGYVDLVEGIDIIHHISELYFRQKTEITNGMQITINNDEVAEPKWPDLNIEILVPANISVDLIGEWNAALIGDIKAPVKVISRSDNNVSVGKVTDAILEVQDDGSIFVDEVNGLLQIVGNGDGAVVVKGGIAHPTSILQKDDGEVFVKTTSDKLTVTGNGDGCIFLGDVSGSVKIELRDDGACTIDRILAVDANLTVASYGEITIKSGVIQGAKFTIKDTGGIDCRAFVDGNLTVINSGDGSLAIAGGQAMSADIQIKDDGNVTCMGIIQGGKVYISGDGSLKVSRASGELELVSKDDGDISFTSIDATKVTVSMSGDGRVDLGDGQITSLDVAINDDGDFNFGGKVEVASLSTKGDGDIIINHVVKVLKEVRKDDGKIRIMKRG
jgi:hypothetical protein